MIMSFSFSNFLSYKERTSISFEASKSIRLTNHIVNDGNNRILKGLVCFGANASGKTNLIKAIDYSRKVILSNFKATRGCSTFKINNNDPISAFSYKFSIDGDVYYYDLLIDFSSNTIVEEKLYTQRKKGNVFTRILDSDSYVVDTSLKLDKEDKKFFDVYMMDYKENKDGHFNKVFFLKDVVMKRSDESQYFKIFKRVYDEIKNVIVIYPETGYGDFAGIVNDDQNFDTFKKLLKEYKIDITDLVEEKIDIDALIPKIDDEEFARKNIEELIKEIKNGSSEQFINFKGEVCSIQKDENGEVNIYKLTLRHGSDDKFDYTEESKGTKRLFDLLPLLMLEKDNGPLVLIDEIEQSLHTLLTKKLIKDLFERKNILKSQFLITTHDINLFNLDILRSDEILLISKDDYHSSNTKSFFDFKRRADRDVVKAYLSGEFGSIPKF